MALKPLRAVGALGLRAVGIMRSLGTLMLKALGRIGLVGKRVAPAAPQGLGMKMHLVTDPKRPDLVIDQFLRLWYWGLPSAVRVAYQVDDQPEQPARRHLGESRAPRSPPSCASRAPRSRAMVAPIGSRCRPGSRWAPPSAPGQRERVSGHPGRAPHRRPRVVWRRATASGHPLPGGPLAGRWRHPGAVGLFVKFTEGSKTTLTQIGVADHQESEYLGRGRRPPDR